MKPVLYRIPGPWSGSLAIAARPRGGDWLDDELRGWRDSGVDVMVSLLEPDETIQLDLGKKRHRQRRTASGSFRSQYPIAVYRYPGSPQPNSSPPYPKSWNME